MSVEIAKQSTLSNIQQKILEIFTEETDRVFLIDSIRDREFTFGEIYHRSLAVATLFRRKGIEPGDRVIYVLPNCYEYAVLYMASLLSGVTAVPVSPAIPPRDIEFIAQHCRAKMIVVADETMPQVTSFINGDLGMDVMYLAQSGDRRNEAPNNAEILDLDALNIPEDDLILPFEDVPEQQRIAIVYTSGTTSRPKGVAHTAANMLNSAICYTRELEIGKENRFYSILSMGYLGGYYNLLMLPFMARASVVIAPAFNARSPLTFWEPVEKYGVNTLWCVPTIMAIMLKVDRSEKGPQLCRNEIKRAIVGTAPLPRKLKQDFEDHYGVKLYENYGLSETFLISAEAPKYPLSGRSVGRVLPGTEVSIVSEKGEPLPYNSEGEIHVRTPFLMQGYYNPEKGEPDYLDRAESFPTGDVGYLTESGELFITGRKKDLIIKGGINISPMAIEDVLHEHEAVEAVAVVGAPHEVYGEDVVAAIKLKEGYDFEKEVERIKELCQQRLAVNQRPSFFFQIDDFPRSATGKIQKAKVKELVLAKFGFKDDAEKPTVAHKAQEPARSKLMVSSKVRGDIKRPSAELIERVKYFPTSIISDCLNCLWAMANCIKPVVRGRPFAGPAFTVAEAEGGNIMSNIALEIVQSGDVLVIDAKGAGSRSGWSGLQTYAAKVREVSGVVISGSVRDYEEIARHGVPVYATGVSPGGTLKDRGGFINYPISCGGVPVLPGDVVVGDDDGVVVIPSDLLEEVLSYCEERAEQEERWYEDMEQGISAIDTVGMRESIEKLGVEFL